MTTDDGAPPPLALPASLDTRAAAALHEALLARQGSALVLDGSAVARLGGLCLELLLSARRGWAAAGLPFRIGDPSPALCESLRGFGAEILLEGAP